MAAPIAPRFASLDPDGAVARRVPIVPRRMRLRSISVGSVVLSLVFVGFYAPSAQADAETPPRPADLPAPARALSLPEALRYARAHQPAVRAALSRIQGRVAEAEIPSGRWLPTVSATAQIYGMTANNTTGAYLSTPWTDVPRIGGTAPVTSPGSATWSPYASTLVGVGVDQEIFDFGRIGAKRAAADALVDVEKRTADATRLEVDFGVEEAYFAVLAAKAVVQASDDAYERSRVHRDFAKRGVDSGMRSPIELTRAEAELARFDVGRIRARGGVAIAQTVLAASIGSTEAAVDVAPEPPAAGDLPALPEAIQLAEARDPLLARALAQVHAAELRTRAVGAELRPDLTVTATLTGRAGGAPSTAGTTVSGDGWVPGIPNWDAGLVLSWPIFDGTIAARRDAARTSEQVARDDLETTRLAEVTRVRTSYAQVEVARTALVALGNTVLAARANYDQADARFKAGIGNAVELADAENVRTDAEIQLAVGQFELARARAAFGRAIAEGL